MQRNKYQSLTIKHKLEITDLVDNAPPGKKKKDIASEVGIPPSTLSIILKNKDALKASHMFGSSTKKRNCDPSHLDVNAALFQWFTAARAQSVPISGEVLKVKAANLLCSLTPLNHGIVLMVGSHAGRTGTTSHTRQVQARMQLLIKRFVMSGRKKFWNHFSTGITRMTFLMQIKQVFLEASTRQDPRCQRRNLLRRQEEQRAYNFTRMR